MITIPSVAIYNDSIVIYSDDEDCNLFYPIRTRPKLRTESGRPVFSSLFWNNYKSSTEEEKARLAGAEISFDVHLGLTEKEKEDVIKYIGTCGIQDQIIRMMKEEEKEISDSKKAFTNESGMNVKMSGFKRNMVKGPVRLGVVHFTDGKVFLNEDAGGQIVKWTSAVNGAKPSLFGDNNASCKLTLQDIGAEVWYRTLKEKTRTLSIGFELEFPVRLPALAVHAYVGSYQHDFTDQDIAVLLVKLDKGCGKSDVEKIDIGVIKEAFIDSGLIKIDIINSSDTVSQDCINQVREGVQNILLKKIEAIMLNRFQGMTLAEREATLIGKVTQEMKAFTELHFTQHDVMTTKIAPQCTMMDFLSDMPADMWNKMLTPVDLRDPVMRPRQVIKVSANAPWDHIHSVVVKARCGNSVSKEITLTHDKSEDTSWILGEGDSILNTITYTATVNFKDRGGFYVFPEATCVGDILVNVGKIGLIDIPFKPHPNLSSLKDTHAVSSIEVQIDCPTKDGQVQTVSFPLAADNPEGSNFKHFVGCVIDKPLTYRVNYGFKSGDTLSTKDYSYFVSENDDLPVYTPFPYSDSLTPFFAVADPDDLDSAEKICIEVDYQDNKNNYSSGGTVYLKKENFWESKSVNFPIIDRAQNAFKYRFTIYGSEHYQSPWLDARGDAGTIILPIERLLIVCTQLGMGTDFSYGQLKIESKDGKFSKKKILDSSVNDRIDIYLPSGESVPKEFTYYLTLYSMDGSETFEKAEDFSSAILFLQNPKKA